MGEIKNKEENNKALMFIKLLLYLGIFAIIIYSFLALSWLNPIQNIITIFGICLLMAGSALAAGSLTGFIFAIPKSVSNSDTNLIKSGKGYISNDNLVQVSDWLTKIIVGVGLTKLTNIPKYIQSLGEYAGKSIGGQRSGEVATESIIIYFTICGFLLAYLWTRLYFGRMLGNAEDPAILPDTPIIQVNSAATNETSLISNKSNLNSDKDNSSNSPKIL